MTKEQEKAIDDLKFFNQGEYITKEMEESAKVVLEKIEKDRQSIRRLCKESNKLFAEVEEKDKEIKTLGELFDQRGEQLELKQIQIELMAEFIDNYDGRTIKTFEDEEHIKDFLKK